MFDVEVSVLVVTFNHENYIKECLDSILSQKVNFTYEVIVQDDNSTDNTALIVAEYASNYPNIIKPIYNSENIYSKGIDIFGNIQKYAQGKYFALCEGDDYWCDDSKLQVQYNYLEKQSEINLVATENYNLNSGKFVSSKKILSDLITPEQMALLGGGAVATASLFMRRKVLEKASKWLDKAPVTDYFVQVLGSKPKGTKVINKKMVVYRVSSVGSWSCSAKKINNVVSFHKRVDELFEDSQFVSDLGESFDLVKYRMYTYLCSAYLLYGDKDNFFHAFEQLKNIKPYDLKFYFFKFISNKYLLNLSFFISKFRR